MSELKHKKHSSIAVIGSGAVGASSAYALILKGVAAEITLVDIDLDRCEGEVLDLEDSLGFSSSSVVRHGTSKEAGQSDIIVITAGAAQKPGQTRQDLVDINLKIMKSVIDSMQPINPDAKLLIVANPVDILTYYAQKFSGLKKNQVFGSGTFLDTQRLRRYLSDKLNIEGNSIHIYILGEHGDTQFPAWSVAQVGGIHLTSFPGVDTQLIEQATKFTREKAYEIIKKKKATYYGIGACVASLCSSILFNQRCVRAVSCYQDSLGVSLSMPAVIGENGIEQILSLNLNEQELDKLRGSVAALKKVLETNKL